MDDAEPARHRLVVELVGRGEEVDALESFLDSCSTGGGALLVTGDAGAGKTVLLDAAGHAATAAGGHVLSAAGVEPEADVSFAGLNQLLLPLIESLPALPDVHRTALTVALGLGDGPTSDRLVIATATLLLLRHAAAVRPMLLVVDDLPWIDRASALVLGFLARRLTGTRIGLLGALRTGEESFFARSATPTLDLIPLDDQSAGALVRERFPTLSPRVRQRVLADARGNPLALLELPRELSAAHRTGDHILPELLPLGRRLQTVFASRVAALPHATRLLLLLTALEGSGDLTIHNAAGTSDMSGVLDPAELAGLVAVDPRARRMSFNHPLIRSAVVELCTDAEKRAAHRELAALRDISADTRARHLADAALGPDESAAVLLEQSAYRVLGRGDATAAVKTLLRAAGMSPLGRDRGRRLAEAAFIGADVTGALADVSALLARARLADPDHDSLPAAIAAAHLLLNSDGDIDTAHHLLIGALGNATPRSTDRRLLEEAMHTLMLVCHYGGRHELWEPFDAVLGAFRGALSPLLTGSAITFGDPVRSDPAELDQLDAIVADLGAETDPSRIVAAGIACLFVDRLDACRGPLLRVIEDGRAGGAVASAVNALILLGVNGFLTGRWDEATRFGDEAIDLCERLGYPLMAWAGRYGQALLAAGRGERARFDELYATMPQWAIPRRAMTVHTYLGHARGLAALGRGDFEDAYQQLAAVSTPGTFPPHQPFALWTVMDLVEASVRTGRRAAAAAHVTAARDLNLAAISPRLALLCAGAAAIAAPHDTAMDLFDAAVAQPDSHRWPFDRARIELAYGERLRRDRRTTLARAHLDTALDLFTGLGAHPWADRARLELHATGRTRHSGDTTTGPGAAILTSQEHEIALLAASGLTNRQIGQRLFLSHRTVSAHLYHVFPKLGITARSGLRDALDSHPSPDTGP